MDKSSHRYFLMRHRKNVAYSLIDRERTGGTWDMPSVSYADCVESADTLPALVGKLWASGDDSIYVTLDWVNSKGQTKHAEYPHHYNDIHVLTGYVEEVCDITEGWMSPYGDEKWIIDFPSDLWIRTDDWTLKRVFGFDFMMRAAVDAYIEENGLKYDDGAEEPWKHRGGRRKCVKSIRAISADSGTGATIWNARWTKYTTK